MGSVEHLARDAGVAVRRVGGLNLVAADDVDQLLDAFERAAVRVVGAEGFRLGDGDVRPDMNAILDIADLDDNSESIGEARSFVKRVATPDLLFEFVIDDRGQSP